MDDDDEGILWLCNYFQHKRKEGSDVGCGNALHSIAKKKTKPILLCSWVMKAGFFIPDISEPIYGIIYA